MVFPARPVTDRRLFGIKVNLGLDMAECIKVFASAEGKHQVDEPFHGDFAFTFKPSQCRQWHARPSGKLFLGHVVRESDSLQAAGNIQSDILGWTEFIDCQHIIN